MSVVVVRTQKQHFDGFYACLDAVCREERYLGFIQAPPLSDAQEYFSDLLDRRCPHFVAVEDNDVIGWVDINVNQLPGFTHSGRLGMGVLSEYRHRGIGRQLLDASLESSRERGLLRIELQVFATNTVAITLYERAGFTTEGIRRRARILHGTPEDIIDMALLLS